MRLARFICIVLATVAALTVPAKADVEKRIALVIGNGKYLNATPLPNPANDARALAGTLGGIGFEVMSGLDLDHRSMEQLLRDFLTRASGTKIALLFYAGHGLQVDGRNYLVPVDARLDSVSDLNFGTIELDRVLASLDDPARATIVILDACRDNPLARSFASRTRSASVGAGLAAYTALGTGTLIAFSTSPGRVAEDGAGANSPFTSSLVRHMATPGLEVRQMLTRVRSDVALSTAERQVPWDNSSLRGDVYLAGRLDLPQAPAPAVPNAAPVDEAGPVWAVTRDTSSVAVLEEFIRRFGTSPYASMARARLAELKASQVASAPVSSQVTPAGSASATSDVESVLRSLPAGVSIDRDTVRTAMTDPFFANAPPMKLLAYADNIATEGAIVFNNDSRTRTLARGILQADTVSRYWSKDKKTDSGVTYRDDTQDVRIMAGNGFVHLAFHRQGQLSRRGKSEGYVTKWTTTKIDRMTGTLFPVAVGKRVSFRTTDAFEYNGKASTPSYSEFTCETTQKRAAAEFFAGAAGDAFVVECRKAGGAKSAKIFFEKFGIFVEADTLNPGAFRAESDRHRTLTKLTARETADNQ